MPNLQKANLVSESFSISFNSNLIVLIDYFQIHGSVEPPSVKVDHVPKYPHFITTTHNTNRSEIGKEIFSQKMSQNPNKTENVEKSSSYNEKNITSLAKRQINDIVEFQEPSSTTNYSFEPQISINILEEPRPIQDSSIRSDSVTLCLFGDTNEQLNKDILEDNERYATVYNWCKEKTTDTHDAQTQRAVLGNSETLPPHENRSPPAYSSIRTNVVVNQPHTTPHSEGHEGEGGGSGGGGYSPHPYESPSFLDIHIRHKFIQKVFLILIVQLLITTAFTLFVMLHEPTRKFVATNLIILYVMIAVEMILYMTLIYYKTPRRIFPLNFILSFIFTIPMSYICAAITILYSTKVVLLTVGSTALICIVVTLLACQTWIDITKWSFIFSIAGVIMAIFSLIVMVLSVRTHSSVLWLVYSGTAVLVFSVYLLYEMQCLLRGKVHQVFPKEYIFAALSLYVDIVLIFMCMLRLINICGN